METGVFKKAATWEKYQFTPTLGFSKFFSCASILLTMKTRELILHEELQLRVCKCIVSIRDPTELIFFFFSLAPCLGQASV